MSQPLFAEFLDPCPFCNGPTDAEFVDIGVGFQQVSPARCNDCGAVQFNPYDDELPASEEEHRAGWHKGER